MNRRIAKLLTSKSARWQAWLAGIGAAVGLIVLMVGIALWVDISRMMQQTDLLPEDYVVISKKVGLLNTLSGGPATFSDEDVQQFSQLSVVKSVGKFSSSRFRASMELAPELSGFGGQVLKTDMFFESVPDGFIDVGQEDWKWTKESAEVPVVIPADIIRQYNHGFAATQGLPVIPEGLLKSIRFKLKLKGNGTEEIFNGKIAGFSDRISTILVPKTFMDYGNSRFAGWPAKAPSRLILKCSNTASPELLRMIDDGGYEVNKEKMKAGKAMLLQHLVLSIVAVTGLLIVLLSLLGFVQYNQLLAYRSAYEIKTLHWLGYSLALINKPYIRAATRQLAFSLMVGLVIFGLSQWMIVNVFVKFGFEPVLTGWALAVPASLVIGIAMYAFTILSIKKQVATLAT